MRPDLSLRPAGVEILLLVGDRNMRKFMLYFLKNQRVIVASSPAAAEALLERRSFGLVILTNFGVGPLHAVEIIPKRRDYPVLFLTGWMSDEIEAVCRAKNIPWRKVPIPLDPIDLHRELSVALSRARRRRRLSRRG